MTPALFPFRWPAVAAACGLLAFCAGGPARADLADEQCLDPPYSQAESPPQLILRGLLDLMQSVFVDFPTLEASLQSQQPRICIDDRPITARGYLEVEEHMIALSENLGQGEMLAILVHELRHLEQLDRGFCPNSELSMSEMARATFALEADAQAVTVLVAWKLRDNGKPEAWDAVSGWSHYADIVQAFERQVAATGDPAAATAAAFAAWYDSQWRVNEYYISSCSDYLDRLDRSKRLPAYQLLPDNFLQSLCQLPDGTQYPCTEPEEPGR